MENQQSLSNGEITTPKSKICSICKLEKDISEFKKDRCNKKDGYCPECKPCEHEVKKRSVANNFENKMLRASRLRALKKNIEFNLTKEDIVIPTHCPILGIPLTTRQGSGRAVDNIASLDRKDSSKGYIKDNVEVISFRANTLKNNATAMELFKVASYVQKFEQNELINSL